MKTFHFNTGVRPYIHHPPVPILEGEVLRGGTLQIPFQCDVPENAAFMFACDNPDLPESKCGNIVVAKIEPGSAMVSEYAYFRCYDTE